MAGCTLIVIRRTFWGLVGLASGLWSIITFCHSKDFGHLVEKLGNKNANAILIVVCVYTSVLTTNIILIGCASMDADQPQAVREATNVGFTMVYASLVLKVIYIVGIVYVLTFHFLAKDSLIVICVMIGSILSFIFMIGSPNKNKGKIEDYGFCDAMVSLAAGIALVSQHPDYLNAGLAVGIPICCKVFIPFFEYWFHRLVDYCTPPAASAESTTPETVQPQPPPPPPPPPPPSIIEMTPFNSDEIVQVEEEVEEGTPFIQRRRRRQGAAQV